MNIYPSAKLLGLSAVGLRYLDNPRGVGII